MSIMNEPFLLSNLIDLQEIDNQIFKLEKDKKGSESVIRLMHLESQNQYHQDRLQQPQ